MEPEIERPKSPWIPSYSISQQGASPLHTPISSEDKELGHLEQLSTPTLTTENITEAEPAIAAAESIVISVADEPALEESSTNGAARVTVNGVAIDDGVHEEAVEHSDVQPSILVEDVVGETVEVIVLSSNTAIPAYGFHFRLSQLSQMSDRNVLGRPRTRSQYRVPEA